MDAITTRLVEKVMQRLHWRKELPTVLDNILPQSGFSRPFITIAREPGSGGHPIGRLVADRLKFKFVDDELIEGVAKSTKQRKEILQQVDEKGRSAIEDLVQGMFNPEYVSDLTFVTELTKVILSYAYRGDVVILGRGANFITPFAQGLHVRITAPRDVRLQRAIDYEGHSPAKAKEVVNKIQKDRKDFVKQYFRRDIEDADYYDLTINTAYFSPNQSADMIINAFSGKFSRTKKFRELFKSSQNK